MSSPDSGQAHDGSAEPGPPADGDATQAERHDSERHDADLPTDPGRSQPFESLYRGAIGSPARAHRTTARHFEPSLTPPEGQPQPDDTFHWLYRKDAEPPPAQPMVDVAESAVSPEPVELQPEPVEVQAETRPTKPPTNPPTRRRKRFPWLGAMVVALLA